MKEQPASGTPPPREPDLGLLQYCVDAALTAHRPVESVIAYLAELADPTVSPEVPDTVREQIRELLRRLDTEPGMPSTGV